MSTFEDMITELGQLLGVSLQVEKEILCKIKMQNGMSIQIEYEEVADRLLLTSFIAELPPGKFREEALLAGLKMNYLDPSLGSFAYVDSKQMLLLQLFLPSSTPSSFLGTILQQLSEKAMQWKEGIEQGNLSSLLPSSLPSPMNFS